MNDDAQGLSAGNCGVNQLNGYALQQAHAGAQFGQLQSVYSPPKPAEPADILAQHAAQHRGAAGVYRKHAAKLTAQAEEADAVAAAYEAAAKKLGV
jgi:hypothetical protein